MENNKYLPVGAIIGKHYEVLDILGEDDFEILYLVRNTERKESFFVIKELFLETFSSRNDGIVSNIPQAQGVFKKRKKEIISEIDNPKRHRKMDEIKTYGYIEECNTIYTIMEFTRNSDLTNYLQFQPKHQMILPSLDELLSKLKKKKRPSLFLIVLLGILAIGAGLALYTYTLFETDKMKADEKLEQILATQTEVSHPILVNRSKEKNQLKKTPKVSTVKKETSPKEVIHKKTTVEKTTVKKMPLIKKNLPKPLIVQVNEPSDILDLNSEVIENKQLFDRASVETFLNAFIASSSKGSVEEILSFYAEHVDRYFSLNNVNHAMIEKDKKQYNKKWTQRAFSIETFKIVKRYKKDNSDCCDVETTTKWKVSGNTGKKVSGKSQGLMRLIKTENGFKVSSIYATN